MGSRVSVMSLTPTVSALSELTPCSRGQGGPLSSVQTGYEHGSCVADTWPGTGQ